MPSASHLTIDASGALTSTPAHLEFTATTNGLTVSVDCSGSYGGSSPIILSSWDFGDGATATGVTQTHTYAVGGTYTITYTATLQDGGTGSTSQSVTVSQAQQTTLGDSGINQTGVAGRTQTGANIVQVSSALGAGFSSAGVGKIASFAAGTFYTSAFTENGGGAAYDTGAAIGTAIGGFYGAGSASTIISIPNGTTPPTETADSSFVISQGANNSYASGGQMPGAYVIDGVKILGPVTSVDYGGVYTYGAGRNGPFTLSNTTIQAGKGSGGSPPAETTMFNLQRAGGQYPVTVSNVTFDGQNQAAAGLETNYFGMNTGNGSITITNLYAKDCPMSAGIAMHGNANGTTADIHNFVSRNNARSLGMEANGGNINVYDPLWDDPTAGHKDMNITWVQNNNEGLIQFFFTAQSDWNAFISTRTNKKITVVCNSTTQTYGDATGSTYTGGKKIADYFKVFIAGVLVGTGESNYATGFNNQ